MMFQATKPLGFRKYLDLENKKSILISAAEDGTFPDKVYAYLSAALMIPVKRLEKRDWESTVQSLLKESAKFTPNRELPIFKDSPKESKPVEWDYEGRTWNYYAHLLAQAYGWTLEYIAELGVDEAFAHLQEILTDEHLDREFIHGLSEISYKYNKSTNTSNYVPLKRPYWMKASVKPIKKTKIRRDLLPMGMGIDLSGMPPEYGIQNIIDNGQR
jgi:hypothetical protein